MMDQDDDDPTNRLAWLRAAVLGADDGIVSTAALMVGVAASNASPQAVLTAGLAGLVAGAASMAAGEYVSVSSQRDLEQALRERENSLAKAYPNVALTELAIALQLQGVDPGLARKVAYEISAAEPIGANVRVKYGISERTAARPLQAALASAVSFAVGAIVPLLGMLAHTPAARIQLTITLALFALAVCGAGGASRLRGSLRVVLGGGLPWRSQHLSVASWESSCEERRETRARRVIRASFYSIDFASDGVTPSFALIIDHAHLFTASQHHRNRFCARSGRPSGRRDPRMRLPPGGGKKTRSGAQRHRFASVEQL